MPILSNILRDMKCKKLTANLYYNENAENDTNFSKDKHSFPIGSLQKFLSELRLQTCPN